MDAFDDGGGWFTGLFDAHCEISPPPETTVYAMRLIEGPQRVSLTTALEWAVGQAPRVYVRVGVGEFFGAGSAPPDDVPRLDPALEVRRRRAPVFDYRENKNEWRVIAVCRDATNEPIDERAWAGAREGHGWKVLPGHSTSPGAAVSIMLMIVADDAKDACARAEVLIEEHLGAIWPPKREAGRRTGSRLIGLGWDWG